MNRWFPRSESGRRGPPDALPRHLDSTRNRAPVVLEDCRRFKRRGLLDWPRRYDCNRHRKPKPGSQYIANIARRPGRSRALAPDPADFDPPVRQSFGYPSELCSEGYGFRTSLRRLLGGNRYRAGASLRVPTLGATVAKLGVDFFTYNDGRKMRALQGVFLKALRVAAVSGPRAYGPGAYWR